MSDSPVRTWSAWVPVAISAAALALVLIHVSVFGAVREPDEGAAAHIWQLLMGLQALAVVFFLFRWVPRSPRHALAIFALQVCAAAAAMAPVYYYHL